MESQPLVAITEERRRLPDITVTRDTVPTDNSRRGEVDSENLETPPVQRKMFSPPPDREPCRRFLPAISNTNTNDKASPEMKDLCQEILGDGQFDRFSAARRTRRYKRSTETSSPEDEKKSASELVTETQVTRPATLEVQAAYPAEETKEVTRPSETRDDTENRLKRWQERLKNQSKDKTPAKDKVPYSRMRRQTSINQEDVQKAIRELKSPTQSPAGVWSRNAYRRSFNAKTDKVTPSAPAPAPAAATGSGTHDRTTSPRILKVKSEHELNDEGFEETQSLNSESASQGASSGCGVDCESPVPKKNTEIPKKIATKDTRPPPRMPLDPRRSLPRRPTSLRVERSASRASLRSSRSSLNSSASVATVKRAPTIKPVPKPIPKPAPRVPASRSSSSGSSIGTSRPKADKTSGFMRPTQASKVRGSAAKTSAK